MYDPKTEVFLLLVLNLNLKILPVNSVFIDYLVFTFSQAVQHHCSWKNKN